MSSSIGLSIAGGAARAEVIEQILVKVNGEIFTKTDLENRQIARLREMQGQKVDLKSDANDAELRKMLDQITPALLVEALDEMLVVQRGKELGYSLPDAQFTTVLESIKTQNKLESEEAFQAALKQEGLTLADLRKNLERQMIWQQRPAERGREQGRDDRRGSARLLRFASSGVHHAGRRHAARDPRRPRQPIREGINVAADETAKARADAIRARALAGESFEKLAADLSESASRANAGLIGPINLDDLSADLRKMIEAMKVGDVAEPLRTTRGYQILKLESSNPTRTMPFEQAREQIANSVAERQAEARIREVPREAPLAGHHRVEEH